VDKKVDQYILKHSNYTEALNILRAILTSTELEETVKWGYPAYTIDGKNVLGLAAFKSYVGIWFHQGFFLKNEEQVLVNAQEGVTKAMRQWRFNSAEEIDTELVLKYVEEAIQNQKDGRELKPEKKKLVMPEELVEALKKDINLNASFRSLSLGKQREYADHISQAKQEKTKLARIEKITPMIIAGVGLHDKYKDC
jgi:uncharacterized protein YdeI (YjbR/CyaY-like superfamily)